MVLTWTVNDPEIAKKMGTKQTAVSRFENYDAEPTISFLMKYAKALGKKMEMRLEEVNRKESPQQDQHKTYQVETSFYYDFKTPDMAKYDEVFTKFIILMSAKSKTSVRIPRAKVINFADIKEAV